MGIQNNNDRPSIAPHMYDVRDRRHCGKINLADEAGSSLHLDAQGHYNLPARVAAHKYLLDKLIDPGNTNREIILNSYMGEAAILHSISCLCAEICRDRNALRLFNEYWDELHPPRQQTLLGQTIDNEAKDIRFTADINFLKAALRWLPESALAGIYRRIAIQSTSASISLAGDEYQRRLAAELPVLQTINPEALPLLQLDRPASAVTIDPDYAAALRLLALLPICEREVGFFNPHVEHTDISQPIDTRVTLTIPTWIADPAHPPEQSGAMNYGHLHWRGEIADEQQDMLLDLRSRRFERIVTDRQHNVTRQIYLPTDLPTHANHYSPGYTVSSRCNDAEPVVTALPPFEMAAKHRESLYNEAMQHATDQLNALAASESVQLLWPKVMTDIERQLTTFRMKMLCPTPAQQLSPEQQLRVGLDNQLGDKLHQAGYSPQTADKLLQESVQKCLASGAHVITFAGFDAERQRIVIQTNAATPIVIDETSLTKAAATPTASETQRQADFQLHPSTR